MPYNERKEYLELNKLKETIVIEKKKYLKEYTIFNSIFFQISRIFFGNIFILIIIL
jgi:hypothetical protein